MIESEKFDSRKEKLQLLYNESLKDKNTIIDGLNKEQKKKLQKNKIMLHDFKKDEEERT